MLDLYIYKNDVLLENVYYFDYLNYPYLIEEADYEAGDVFKLNVDYFYFSSPVKRDYTVKVYSKQDLSIVDEDGNTNMLHMDGSEPSGFDSSFLF